MKYSLLSLVAGTMACNARCPFCISKMTPAHGMTMAKPMVDWRNFSKAVRLASDSGVQTVMITGKGEPALFPDQITEYLSALSNTQFPFIELQTNGILFQEKHERYDQYLKDWYQRGLTTIAVSIVHYEREANRSVYLPHRSKYIELERLIEQLHSHNFTVRLAAVLCNGMIDSPESLSRLIDFARVNGVEQLAIRPVTSPEAESDPSVHSWVKAHAVSEEKLSVLRDFIEREGVWLYRFPHGGEIYDIGGQNLCITNCLTRAAVGGEVRQLIFFPDGTLSFDWQHQGALLLRGRYREQTSGLTTLKRVV